MMNKVLTSLNTFFFVILSVSIIFSLFSIPKLDVEETKSTRVNFYEVMQQEEKSLKTYPSNKKLKKEANSTYENNDKREIDNISKIPKFEINKSHLKNEISKIKLSRERKDILRVSTIIQNRISSIWIKPNSLSDTLSAKVLINLAPSGEILNFIMTEPSTNKSFNDSILSAMNKLSFFEEILVLERKLFEENFRNFKLVFKSSGEID